MLLLRNQEPVIITSCLSLQSLSQVSEHRGFALHIFHMPENQKMVCVYLSELDMASFQEKPSMIFHDCEKNKPWMLLFFFNYVQCETKPNTKRAENINFTQQTAL